MSLKENDSTKAAELWVYMLLCNDGTIYTGMTTSLETRIRQHQNKTARCKFTRRSDKHPLVLGAAWSFTGTKGNALSLERYIKGLNPLEKRMLLNDGGKLLEFLERDAAPFPCAITPFGGQL